MSGPKKYLRTEGGERIDQPDFEHAAEESQLTGVSQIGETFIVGPDARGQFSASLKSFVLSGLQVTCPDPNTIMVGAGTAILSWNDQGNVEHGVIIDVGTSESVTLSGGIAGADTFGVFVRFNLREEQSENRNFWNALAVTPVEITRQMATRRVDDMEITFASDPETPGTEWTKLAEIIPDDLVAGTLAGITDLRDLFFEGVEDDPDTPFTPPYRVTDAQWGTADDRNADRAVYGLKGMRQFIRATQRQLQDIIGGAGLNNWWDNTGSIPFSSPDPADGPLAGMSLKYAKDEAFSRLGDNADRLAKWFSGRFLPAAASTDALDIGSNTQRWGAIHAAQVLLGNAGTILGAVSRLIIPAGGAGGTEVMTRLLQSIIGTGAADKSTIEFVRLLPSSTGVDDPGGADGSFGITVNCFYDNTATHGLNDWGRYDNARDSYLFEFGGGAGTTPTSNLGFRVLYHDVGGSNVWSNQIDPLHWRNLFDVGRDSGTVATAHGTLTASVLSAPTVETSFLDADRGIATAALIGSGGTPVLNPIGSGIDLAKSNLPRQVGTVTVAIGGASILSTHQMHGSFTASLVTVDAASHDTIRISIPAASAFSWTAYAVMANLMDSNFGVVTQRPLGPVIGVPVTASTFDIAIIAPVLNPALPAINGSERVAFTTIAPTKPITFSFMTFGL